MADQPGDNPPDARPPDPTRVGEPSTVDAPVRWSGSASIPPPQPKKSLWPRRGNQVEEDDDWGKTPAVDPWAGQDTPWDPLQLPAPEPVSMPPTRLDAPAPPPTRVEAPAPPPPTRVEAPAPPPPTRVAAPPVAAPPPPPPPSPPKVDKRAERRAAKLARKQPPPEANRLPVQPRPGYVPPKYAQQVVKPPPKGLPPAPRKRHPIRKLGTFALLSLVFCCGVPALFLWPAFGQYPVDAVLPDAVSDLARRDDATSRRAAQRLATELNDGNAFAGIYTDGNGKRVTIFGTTGLRITPKQDVEAQIRQLTADYDIRDVRDFDMGETGVHERCGTGKAGRNTVVVCAWADHGSLVTVLMTRRSVNDSADLTAVLRSAVLTHG